MADLDQPQTTQQHPAVQPQLSKLTSSSSSDTMNVGQLAGANGHSRSDVNASQQYAASSSSSSSAPSSSATLPTVSVPALPTDASLLGDAVMDVEEEQSERRGRRAAAKPTDYTFSDVFKDNTRRKGPPAALGAMSAAMGKVGKYKGDAKAEDESAGYNSRKKLSYSELLIQAVDELKRLQPKKPVTLPQVKKLVAAGIEGQQQLFKPVLLKKAINSALQSQLLIHGGTKHNFDVGPSLVAHRAAMLAAEQRNGGSSGQSDAWNFQRKEARVNANLARAAMQSARQRNVSAQQQAINEMNDMLRALRTEYNARRDEFVFQNWSTFQPFLGDSVANHIQREHANPSHQLERQNAAQKVHQQVPHTRMDKVEQAPVPPLRVYPTQTDYSQIQPPKCINASLRPYQVESLRWFARLHDHGMSGILADEMGLGKTLQTITMIAWLRENRGMLGPHLVIVPLNVLETWVDECKKFAPSMKIIRYHGNEKERQRIQDEQMAVEHFDILVTTFETLVHAEGFFVHRQVFAYVIVDEGHRIKNEQSLAAQAIRHVPCFNRLLLTGTPVQNNLLELWALLNFLYPTLFTANTAEMFKRGFNALTGAADPALLQHAQKLLEMVMIRRLKRDVAPNLPAKTEWLIPCPMSSYQTYWYRNFLSIHHEMLSEQTNEIQQKGDVVVMQEREDTAVDEGDIARDTVQPSPTVSSDGLSTSTSTNSLSTKVKAPKNPRASPTMDDDERNLMEHMQTTNTTDDSWRKLMNLMCRLRQVANHPFMLRGARPESFDVFGDNDVIVTSGKMKILDALLEKLYNEQHRVLIFSSFTMMLDLLEEYMNIRGYRFLRLDGSTSRVQRKFEIDRFNKDRSFFVYLISTRAGGLGVNLPTADTVIHYDSDWNPQADLQAQDRAHRIGQTKPVSVYRLVTSGSVEERMVARAQKKLFLDAKVMNSGGLDTQAAALERWTKGTILEIIKHGAGDVFASDAASELANIKNYQVLQIEPVLKAAVMIRHSHNKDNKPTVKAELNGIKAEKASPTEEVNVAVLDNVLEKKALNINISELAINSFGGKTLNKKEYKDQATMWVEELDARNNGTAPDANNSSMYGGVKRSRTSTGVYVNGDFVLKQNNYDSFTSDLGRAVVPDSRVIDVLYRPFARHQVICAHCKEGGEIVLCSSCPLSYHPECLGMTAGELSSQFRCPQHECAECERRASDAGGTLFRCAQCVNAYCEEHLPSMLVEPIFDIPTLTICGYNPSKNAYYIICSDQCQKDWKREKALREREIQEVLRKTSVEGIQEETKARIRVLLACNAVDFEELESKATVSKPSQLTLHQAFSNGSGTTLTTSTDSLSTPMDPSKVTPELLEQTVKELLGVLDMRAETPTSVRKQVEERLQLPINSLRHYKKEIASFVTSNMHIWEDTLKQKTHTNGDNTADDKDGMQVDENKPSRRSLANAAAVTPAPAADSKPKQNYNARPELRHGEYVCPFIGQLRSDSHKVCDRVWKADTDHMTEKFLRHRRDAHPEYDSAETAPPHLVKPTLIKGAWQCPFRSQKRADTQKPCVVDWPADMEDIIHKFNKHKEGAHPTSCDPKLREREQLKKNMNEQKQAKDALRKQVIAVCEKEKANVGEMPYEELLNLSKPDKRLPLYQLARVNDQFYSLSPRSPILQALHYLLFDKYAQPKSAVKQNLMEWSGLPANATPAQAYALYTRLFNGFATWKADSMLELGRIFGLQTRTAERKLANGKSSHTVEREISRIDSMEGMYQAVSLFLLVPRLNKQFTPRSLLQVYEDEKFASF